jgi:hypothetical protein
MDVQSLFVYIIVGIAVLYTARKVGRQFSSHDDACPKCSGCASSESKENPLIQIEEPER